MWLFNYLFGRLVDSNQSSCVTLSPARPPETKYTFMIFIPALNHDSGLNVLHNRDVSGWCGLHTERAGRYADACCQLCPPGKPWLVRSMEQLSPAGLIRDRNATTTETSWPCSDMTHHLHTLHALCAGEQGRTQTRNSVCMCALKS